MNILSQSAIFLGAAVIAVPLSRKVGLGALLGYLIAGIAIGPHVLGLIKDVDDVLHFAELGVVLLLFIIGLELKPSRLWAMRKPVFGLGTIQMLLTSAIIFGASMLSGLDWRASLVIGLSLSLSSTAVALQILAEKKQLLDAHGRASFGVLLFQDLAIVPILALIPLLVVQVGEAHSSVVLSTIKAIGAIVGLLLVGRYLLRPIFRAIALSGVREVFTAAALLLVVGAGLVMQSVGFSMAMGAFLAGVLLADSEYRHELEADIEPFKGLLLGLFFIAVGMSVNLKLLISMPLMVIGLTLLFLFIKFSVLYGLGRWYGLEDTEAKKLGVTIFQGGEFAFVIMGLTSSRIILDDGVREMIILVVSLSMMLTPIIMTLVDRYFDRHRLSEEPEYDEMTDEHNQVVIAGFGRFGQIIGRLLSVRKIPFTALDASPTHVDFVRKFGNKIYFGDAERLDLLHAAGLAEAKVLVIALDDMEATNRVAETTAKHFPHIKIFVRARNRQHVFQLMDLGMKNIVRETFLSSLDMGEDVLRAIGVPISVASDTIAKFKHYDRELLKVQHVIHKDTGKMIESGLRSRKQLQELFERDAESLLTEMSQMSEEESKK